MSIRLTHAEISADRSFPMEIYFCLLYSDKNDNNPYSVMPQHPFCTGWGIGGGKQITINDVTPFTYLEVAWLSLIEHKFYYSEMSLQNAVDKVSLRIEDDYDNLIIGLAPAGNIVLWANNGYSSVLLDVVQCKEVDISISEFLEYNYEKSLDYYCRQTIIECNSYIDRCDASNFMKRMKQYCYCLKTRFFNPDQENNLTEIPIKSVQASYYDGSFNHKNDNKLMTMSLNSIPKQINLTWDVSKTEYLLSLFFDQGLMREVFARFYGLHNDTKTDFLIFMEPENKKYELALYRQGLNEPVVIPTSAYQLIVFKNKFEDYRSENYNQPRGAWIW